VAEISPLPPLLVFADDWGRHPSSCQHLIGELLDRHQVYWINTIGMRTPRLDLATLRRGAEKLRHWFRRPRAEAQAVPNLRVLNPRMWPWFGSRFARWLNRQLLSRQLKASLKSLVDAPIAVTTLPIVADLVGRLPVLRWVYYCVDDFGLWPGLDQQTLRQMEESLVRKADEVIAVSETLRDKLAQMGREAPVLTHGVDLDFWSGSENDPPELQPLGALEGPLVVFWGVIDRRMDVALVKQLAADLVRGTIVLVGPEADPDPALYESPRVVHLPAMPFQHLPQLARHADVLIMPYADLPVTRAIQPLKLKEYLATGKPTVVRDLPAVRPWFDCLDLAQTPEEFSQAVRLRLADGLPPAQKEARRRLSEESWAAKARDFERWALAPELNRHAVICS